jgi:AcrR family transcriptional regulator
MNMSRPIKYDDDVLLESLRATFLELGPAATSAELARRAGVSEGTLFKRFGTKRRLFELAMHISPIEEQEWFKSMLDRAGQGSLRENLAELAHSLITYITETMPILETLMTSGFRPQDMLASMSEKDQEPSPLVLQRRFEKYLEREMRVGRMRSVDSRTLADLLLGPCFKYVHLHAHFPGQLGNETAQHAAERIAGLIAELTTPTASPTSLRSSGSGAHKAR